MKNPFLSGKTFRLDEFTEPQLPTYAYAVNKDGEIVEKQFIGTDGTFNFETKSKDGLSLLIAPEPKGAPTPKDLKDLQARDAYQPVAKFNPRSNYQDILAIPDALIRRWIFCFCRVRVTLQQEFCFYLPGFPPFGIGRRVCIPFPVCNARVHVCRVTPRIFTTLPARDILRIRDRIIELPRRWPLPLPEPDPIFPRIATTALSSMVSVPPNLAVLDASLLGRLQTNSIDLLRSTLADNLVAIRPWLPYLDICSLLYRCEEIFVAEADENGRIDEGFWHNCTRDENLYFWVEYLFDGNWVTVYRPNLCSGTYWNFECGDEITLTINDPRVGVCQPTKSRFMYLTRIGNAGYLPRINQTSGLVSGLSGSGFDDSAGSTPSAALQRPFGGTLSLWCDFGSELPEAATATHYRVSYKEASAADVETNWEVINNDVYRAFGEEVEGSDGIVRTQTRSFNLRDDANPGFYIIPENEASNQPGIIDPTGYQPNTREWVNGTDFVIAQWNSTTVPAGDYVLRVQLCRMVGGSLQPVELRREIFQTPRSLTELFISDIAPLEHLYRHTSAGEAGGMVIRLHIDNRACTSLIDNAIVNGSAADPDCGLLYTNLTGPLSARLRFMASHPDNQGTFSFSMVRGNGNTSGLTGVNVSGIIGESPVNDYDFDAISDYYTKDFPNVDSWLSAGACANGAAFAETLEVKALATDGSVRLGVYDAPTRVAAFAIIKECTCEPCDCEDQQ